MSLKENGKYVIWSGLGDIDDFTYNKDGKKYVIIDSKEHIESVLSGNDIIIVTTLIEDMSDLFQSTKNDQIKISNQIGNWDVSNVTNMSRMFQEFRDFSADISNWDVSNVTNMRGMFQATKSFNSDITCWDVSKVMDMSYMFHAAKGFKRDISAWKPTEGCESHYFACDATNLPLDYTPKIFGIDKKCP